VETAERGLHAKRIEACIELISRALRGEISTRGELVKELELLYERWGIEPIRGRTKINIYDKELCTVYVVAKYGLGLEPDTYRDFYEKFLGPELRAERAAEKLKEGRGADAVLEEFGAAGEEVVFRIARLEATAVLLGFKREEGLASLLSSLERSFPHLSQKILGFKRFFVAFKLAQAIAVGLVSNRLEKEAYKHALCLRLGAPRAAPSDDLVREILVNVLKGSERLARSVLMLKALAPSRRAGG